MNKIFFFMVLAITFIAMSQDFTQSSVKVNIPGRSVKESVLIVDCPHVGDSVYTDTGGLDLTADYYPQELMRAVVLTEGTGNVGIMLAGGGQMVIPVVVDSTFPASEFFTGWQIKKILADSITTFTGKVFPIW